MSADHNSGRLVELDALRGIAAAMVVLFHYTWKMPDILPHVESTGWGLPWGEYGVELFFAISGFVIFMTLERTRQAPDFLVSRFARLFPAYWVAIIFTTLAVNILSEPLLQQPWQVVSVNFTMLQGFLYLPPVDGVYWSLTVELAFYACMLLLWRLKLLDHIEAILIGWIGLKLLWLAVPALPSRIGMFLLVEYIPYFAIGIAAYRVRVGARRWMQQLPVLAAGLASLLIAHGPQWSLVYAGVVIVFWALVSGQLSLLGTRPLIWLGGISYPLYLVHENIGFAAIDYLERAGMSVWPAIIIAIAPVLLLSDLIHRLVELPSQAFIRNWWRGRAKPQLA